MKLRCVRIAEDYKIPILDEITITKDNMLYIDNDIYSTLNSKEISIYNKELDFMELDPFIYAISTNTNLLTDYDEETKSSFSSPLFINKNIKIQDKQLWGDIIIVKIVENKIYGLTEEEIDKYISLLKI